MSLPPAMDPPAGDDEVDPRVVIIHLYTRMVEIGWRATLVAGRATLADRDRTTLENIIALADTNTVPAALRYLAKKRRR